MLNLIIRQRTHGKWSLACFWAVALSMSLAGCKPSANEAWLADTAKALAKAADECLIDVRDRKLKYDKAPNCMSLRPLYINHMEAGGFRPETPAQYALTAAQAQATAWSARAMSEAGNLPVTIW